MTDIPSLVESVLNRPEVWPEREDSKPVVSMNYPVNSYKRPFSVIIRCDQTPAVVDADGQAVLGLYWPIHEPTKEGEDFATADTFILAEKVAILLNHSDTYGDIIFMSEPTAEDPGMTWKQVAEKLMSELEAVRGINFRKAIRVWSEEYWEMPEVQRQQVADGLSAFLKQIIETVTPPDEPLATEVTRLRAENEHLRMEDGLSKFYAQKDEIERLRAELQNCNDLCSIEDGGGTVSQVLARKLEKLRAELETERRKVEVAELELNRLQLILTDIRNENETL